MSEMPDGWSVGVDGEKSSSTSRLKPVNRALRVSESSSTRFRRIPFRAPSGDFAAGVECE
jgi:hypothetical protein